MSMPRGPKIWCSLNRRGRPKKSGKRYEDYLNYGVPVPSHLHSRKSVKRSHPCRDRNVDEWGRCRGWNSNSYLNFGFLPQNSHQWPGVYGKQSRVAERDGLICRLGYCNPSSHASSPRTRRRISFVSTLKAMAYPLPWDKPTEGMGSDWTCNFLSGSGGWSWMVSNQSASENSTEEILVGDQWRTQSWRWWRIPLAWSDHS